MLVLTITLTAVIFLTAAARAMHTETRAKGICPSRIGVNNALAILNAAYPD